MFLFKPEHKPLILNGTKNETRRLWKKCRAKKDSIHQCRTELFGKPFCLVRVKLIWREPLIDITEEGAHREGYESREEYLKAWFRINPKSPGNPVVWVVRFTIDLYGSGRCFEGTCGIETTEATVNGTTSGKETNNGINDGV